ncbi:MAG: AbrB/MazE/SpoVT family DNA-binding domain-containing protein [Acidilobus sp.]|nr:AbrB/MazE/SpoVT family DNA-binding domain-containing protein [Acidilobus sp.]
MSSHEDKMPLLVKRRVQVTGGSTYIISIPKEWAKLLNINKGSEVVLELSKEGWIRITSAATGRRGQRAIDIELNDGLSEAAFLMQIIAAYLAGYDVIRVRFSPSLSEVAERVVSQVRSKVLGLELLEESGEQMTLRNVVDLTSMSVESVIDDLVRVVGNMIKEVVDVVSGLKGPEVLEGVTRRDDIVDKLYLYIFKQLNLALQGLMSPGELGMKGLAEVIGLYTMVKSLERIADQVVSIAQGLSLSLGEMNPELRDLFKEVSESVGRVLGLVRSRNRAAILTSYEELHSLAVKLTNYTKARSAACEGACYLVMDGLKRIVAQGIDLLEALMGLEFLKQLETRG